MKRRTFIQAIAGGLLAAPLAAEAQQGGKVWRVGFLSGGARPPDGAPPAALRQALRELGYVEGTNVISEGRWAEARRERFPDLAAELVGLKVDVIVTTGGQAASAARQATTTIPIVITNAGDAVATGLIASLARPGANITGVTDPAAELSTKRLELLKEAVPKASRIAILWNADDLGMTLRYRQIEGAARMLHVTVQPLGVREPEDFEAAFSAMTRERPDALFLVTDALTTLNRKRVFDFAAIHRIPAMYEFGSLVKEGGLMSYGPDPADSFRRAAVYVDRIVKGAKPADLPVEQPTRYFLLINFKTAKALGLTIPQSVLARADELIQ